MPTTPSIMEMELLKGTASGEKAPEMTETPSIDEIELLRVKLL